MQYIIKSNFHILLFNLILGGCQKEAKTDTDKLIDLGVPKNIANVVGGYVIGFNHINWRVS
ncbi:hypothetical protein AN960_14875 [Bacillus sp. FJAT-25509]|nr:hypothetical protein AN960_14875 [Bacillus sp. FJAT-25509]